MSSGQVALAIFLISEAALTGYFCGKAVARRELAETKKVASFRHCSSHPLDDPYFRKVEWCIDTLAQDDQIGHSR